MKNSSLLKKLLKVLLNAVWGFGISILRGLGVFNFPVPPNSSMRKTSSKSIIHYYLSGIRTYLPIATMSERVGLNLRDGGLTILDFGCGVGRQLLHFTRIYPSNQYHACDIDDTSVAFIAKNYPQVKSHINRFTPPLNFPDCHFDLIYSVSIFSHLNMDDQTLWLKELARVSKPGGYLFLTTEGYTALKSLCAAFRQDQQTAADTLRRNGYIYKEYEGWEEDVAKSNTIRIASILVGVEKSYGNTVVSPVYVREKWCAFDLSVVDVIEGIIDHRQDLVVLRRNVQTPD